jgi:NADPH-dependent glutamate synthase beta subunit-like oxidoreductase
LHKEGVLNAVDFSRCIRVFDDMGRFNPHLDHTQKISLGADTVIVAIGQIPDTRFLEKIGLPAERIDQVDPLTLQGPDEMVFLAGDVVDGPSSVVEAMAKGRRAAESVDRFLTGEHLRYGREYAGPVETDFEIDTNKGVSGKRARIPVRGLRGKEDFQELEQGLDKDTARKEAQRCYSCGEPFGKYRTCWFCLPCEVECPHEALWVDVPYLLR